MQLEQDLDKNGLSGPVRLGPVHQPSPGEIFVFEKKGSLDFLIPALNLSILETLYWRVFL